jgi:hypothetical protein
MGAGSSKSKKSKKSNKQSPTSASSPSPSSTPATAGSGSIRTNVTATSIAAARVDRLSSSSLSEADWEVIARDAAAQQRRHSHFVLSSRSEAFVLQMTRPGGYISSPLFYCNLCQDQAPSSPFVLHA